MPETWGTRFLAAEEWEEMKCVYWSNFFRTSATRGATVSARLFLYTSEVEWRFLIDHQALNKESPRTMSIMCPLAERSVNNLIQNLLFDFLDYWINISWTPDNNSSRIWQGSVDNAAPPLSEGGGHGDTRSMSDRDLLDRVSKSSAQDCSCKSDRWSLYTTPRPSDDGPRHPPPSDILPVDDRSLAHFDGGTPRDKTLDQKGSPIPPPHRWVYWFSLFLEELNNIIR